MQRNVLAETRTHDALVAFLDEHAGATYANDVGPLIGQACELRDHPSADAGTRRWWQEAVNVALTSEASREVGPWATTRRRSSASR